MLLNYFKETLNDCKKSCISYVCYWKSWVYCFKVMIMIMTWVKLTKSTASCDYQQQAVFYSCFWKLPIKLTNIHLNKCSSFFQRKPSLINDLLSIFDSKAGRENKPRCDFLSGSISSYLHKLNHLQISSASCETHFTSTLLSQSLRSWTFKASKDSHL